MGSKSLSAFDDPNIEVEDNEDQHLDANEHLDLNIEIA